MIKLRVLSKYRNQRTSYAAGSIIEVSEAEGAFLMKDAPECFAIIGADPKPYETKEESRVAGFEMPPADKQMRRQKAK